MRRREYRKEGKQITTSLRILKLNSFVKGKQQACSRVHARRDLLSSTEFVLKLALANEGK